jgi:vesicle-fusing ATPase
MLKPHASIEPQCVALNAIQRRVRPPLSLCPVLVPRVLTLYSVSPPQLLRVSAGDITPVTPFTVPRKDFELALVTMELEFVKARGPGSPQEQVDAPELAKQLQKRFVGQVFTEDQKMTFEYVGQNYLCTVTATLVDGTDDKTSSRRGMLVAKTPFVFQARSGGGIKVINQRGGSAPSLFKSKDLSFEKLGIGGMDAAFNEIFRRAFASRVFPPHVVQRLGIQHVRGMLLHGPPGTGKTLIARQIGKMLNGKEPKVVNGPEVLNKFVGQSEENIRNLFADAEAEYAQKGDDSDLHIIIFDEIDSVCKQRGSSRDGTGVGDSVVNQLLTKIDGVNALPNILLIGMTNRKDLLDDALMRPGRLEVMIEIGLPDEKGRLQILKIKSASAAANSFLAPDVDLPSIAARTKNFSGAELEGLMKSAVSFALSRQVDASDLSKPIDEDNIKITQADFDRALQEVVPAFGASSDALERCRLNGIISTGPRFEHLLKTARLLVEQVRVSDKTPLLTLLLEGVSGAGKTALAATLAIESGFPFVKLASAETMVGWSEASKTAELAKLFDNAYKSPLSVILLDDIERLLEYVSIGPRFSNAVLQALLVLLKRTPPPGHKLLVIGTTSEARVLDDMAVSATFNVVLTVPVLSPDDTRRVLTAVDAFSPTDTESALALLDPEMPIKRLLMLLEMARQGAPGAAKKSGRPQRITFDRFCEVMSDLAGDATEEL